MWGALGFTQCRQTLQPTWWALNNTTGCIYTAHLNWWQAEVPGTVKTEDKPRTNSWYGKTILQILTPLKDMSLPCGAVSSRLQFWYRTAQRIVDSIRTVPWVMNDSHRQSTSATGKMELQKWEMQIAGIVIHRIICSTWLWGKGTPCQLWSPQQAERCSVAECCVSCRKAQLMRRKILTNWGFFFWLATTGPLHIQAYWGFKKYMVQWKQALSGEGLASVCLHLWLKLTGSRNQRGQLSWTWLERVWNLLSCPEHLHAPPCVKANTAASNTPCKITVHLQESFCL